MAGQVGRKMEDGLLHADIVEWPSVRFLRESHKQYKEAEIRKLQALKSKRVDTSNIMSLFRLVDIWRAICKVVHSQLCKGKGTRIDGIGVITLDVKLNPAFFPDNLFKTCYGIIPNKSPTKGSTMTQSLPFVHIAKITRNGATRNEIEKVIEIIANGLRWALDRNVPSLMLQVGHIGEIVIGEGKYGGQSLYIGLRFGKEFLKHVKDSQQTKPPISLGLQMEKRRLKIETENRFKKSNLQALGVLDLSAGQRPGEEKLDKANSLVQDTKKAIKYLRKRLFQRHGMYAIRDCRQILKVMDDTGDGEVNREELKHGFRGLGITLSSNIVESLFLSMDRDGSGTLSINELYLGLRGKMLKNRLKLINFCFNDLYKRAGRSVDASAEAIPVSFLFSEFNCDHFPDVQSGHLKFDDEREKFLAQLDNDMVKAPKGFITKAKFLDFYEDLNEGFDTDTVGEDYFNFMVRSTWNYWDMKGFEEGRKANNKTMKKDFRNDFENDDCDDEHSVDEFSPNRQNRDNDDDGSRSISSRTSNGSKAAGGASKRNHKKKTTLKRDPVPWDCNEAWTHNEMRSSIVVQPELQKMKQIQMNDKKAGIISLSVNGLPPDVFGDLSLLLSPKKLSWEVSYLPPDDHWNKLRLLFFNPPCSFTEFCRNLNVNVVEEDPPITATALISRCYESGKSKPEFSKNLKNNKKSSSSYDDEDDASQGNVFKEKPWSSRKAEVIIDSLFKEARNSSWDDVNNNKYDSNEKNKHHQPSCHDEHDEDDMSLQSFDSRSTSSTFSYASGVSSVGGGGRGGKSGSSNPVVSMSSSNALPVKWLFLKLEQLYGGIKPKGKQSTVFSRVRLLILEKSGLFGLFALKNQLIQMDEDRSLTLNEKELKEGFNSLGIYLNIREMEELFSEFEHKDKKEIKYNEFMVGIKGLVSKKRKKLIKKAWISLNHGSCSRSMRVGDLAQCFDCEWFPSVNTCSSDYTNDGGGGGGGGDDLCHGQKRSSTRKQKKNINNHLLDVKDIENAFKSRYHRVDNVTFRDFYEFHHDLSAVTPGDRFFETIVRNMWHLN